MKFFAEPCPFFLQVPCSQRTSRYTACPAQKYYVTFAQNGLASAIVLAAIGAAADRNRHVATNDGGSCDRSDGSAPSLANKTRADARRPPSAPSNDDYSRLHSPPRQGMTSFAELPWCAGQHGRGGDPSTLARTKEPVGESLAARDSRSPVLRVIMVDAEMS